MNSSWSSVGGARDQDARGVDASPPTLEELLRDTGTPPEDAGLEALTLRIRERFGSALAGIVFYGSVLREGGEDGLYDLLAVVDDYAGAYTKKRLALLNRILPPNVFYLEVHGGEKTWRSKYAVISMRQFRRHVGRRCLQVYFWGRFAQPAVLLHPRDEASADGLRAIQATAVRTFLAKVLPVLPERSTLSDVWRRGLELSYGTELRAEARGVGERLFARGEAHFRRITPPALAELPFPASVEGEGEGLMVVTRIHPLRRRFARLGWAARRVQGKTLNILRLLKALLTFEGGVDYVLWKIERHSGVRVEVSDRVRRHPILAGLPTLWRLYRRGAFR